MSQASQLITLWLSREWTLQTSKEHEGIALVDPDNEPPMGVYIYFDESCLDLVERLYMRLHHVRITRLKKERRDHGDREAAEGG